MKFRNTRKAQLQAIIEESLSAAPKKSISLSRKTGSSILKGCPPHAPEMDLFLFLFTYIRSLRLRQINQSTKQAPVK